MDRSEKCSGKSGVLKLAPLAASRNTTEALRYLLREAEAGRITGLAFVAIQHGPDYLDRRNRSRSGGSYPH